MPEEIERLAIAIESNIEALVDGAEKGSRRLEDRLKRAGDQGEKALGQAGKSAGRLGFEIGAVSGLVQTLTQNIIGMAQRGISAITGIIRKGIEMRGEFETAQKTFTGIFRGNEQAAAAFLDNLKQTAQGLKVPFTEAQQFAKSILPDTSSVDEFNELLRLAAIGARDANLPLQELIFSFNEAVSGDFVSIRDRLDIPRDVIKRIKEADDTTGALTEELNKLFTKRGINDLEAFNDTLSGTTANIQAFADNLTFIAGQPGFEVVQEAASKLQAVLNENKPQLEAIALALGEVAAAAIELVSTKVIENIEGLDTDAVLELTSSLGSALETAGLLVDTFDNLSINQLLEEANRLVQLLDKALLTAAQINTIASAQQASQEAQERQAAKEFGFDPEDPISRATASLGRFFLDADAQSRIDAAGQEAYNQAVLDALPAFDEYNKRQEERIERQKEAAKTTDSDAAALEEANRILEDNADALGKAGERQKELIRKLGIDLIEAQQQANEALEQNQKDHLERMAEIAEDGAEKRAEINEKFDEQIRDKRSDILERAREDLAELEEETDRDLAEERTDANREEFRRTEDHLKDMRRLREQFLFDLEDAVTSRDARAVIDLQRRFRREQSERLEDFNDQESRRREDRNLRLQEIREDEQRRSQEIIVERTKALSDLQTTTEQARQKELATLEEDLAARREKERENFAERNTLLNEALERQLEQIAISLANQGDVTEEGAANILGILAEHFGVGGKVDELMKEFRERVADLGELELKVEASFDRQSTSSSSRSGGGATGKRIRPFASGGSMVATPPGQLALFGERVPELAQFTPLNQMQDSFAGMQNKEISLKVEMAGSAPPGIRSGDRDQIAGVFVQALRDAGLKVRG